MQTRAHANANDAYHVRDMGRSVFWYVLRNCERAVHLGVFAQSIHARALRLSSSVLAHDPLRAVHLLARRTLKQDMSCFASARTVRLVDACARVRGAVHLLPPQHRFVTTAIHTNHCSVEGIAKELRVSLGMVALYYEQARAMLRANGSSLPMHEHTPAASGHMLLAQSAAHWLFTAHDQRHLRRAFADWMLTSPTHIAELLISCTDELVLAHALSGAAASPA
jgi:hypothetical protein